MLASRVRPDQRSKRTLAEGLPDEPGSTSSWLRTGGPCTSARPPPCVAGCAATSPPRRPVPGSSRWSGSRPGGPIVCTSELEASVREVRLIAEHQPHNRRSRHADRPVWRAFTDEAVPAWQLRTPWARPVIWRPGTWVRSPRAAPRTCRGTAAPGPSAAHLYAADHAARRPALASGPTWARAWPRASIRPRGTSTPTSPWLPIGEWSRIYRR